MRALLFLSIALLALAVPFTQAQQKCRALVLQGGGDKGSYQAGVLAGFINNTATPEDFEYNVITGISVGALNGLWIAQYDLGKENIAFNNLVDIWLKIEKKNVYTSWPLGILQGLIFKHSAFNSDNEYSYMKAQFIDLPSKRNITIVATDATTGHKISYTEKDWGESYEPALAAAMASSAVPVVFQPRQDGDLTLIDGGWSGEGLDIEDAIVRCRDVVANDSDIIVDVIFAGNISQIDVRAEKYKAFQVYLRYSNIVSYIGSVKSFSYGKIDYPHIDFRHVVIASERLAHQDFPLFFDHPSMQSNIALGVKDAITQLQAEVEGTRDNEDFLLHVAKFYERMELE